MHSERIIWLPMNRNKCRVRVSHLLPSMSLHLHVLIHRGQIKWMVHYSWLQSMILKPVNQIFQINQSFSICCVLKMNILFVRISKHLLHETNVSQLKEKSMPIQCTRMYMLVLWINVSHAHSRHLRFLTSSLQMPLTRRSSGTTVTFVVCKQDNRFQANNLFAWMYQMWGTHKWAFAKVIVLWLRSRWL